MIQALANGGDRRIALEEDPEFWGLLEQMHDTILADREDYNKLHDYREGKHVVPHAPRIQRAEISQLARRATTNLIDLAVNIPAQLSFVDGYRRDEEMFPPEWDVWVRSRMAQKQTTSFVSALTYGNAYIALENLGTEDRTLKLLPTRDTVAFYYDPVNDRYPSYVLTIRSRPRSERVPGVAVYYDAEQIVELNFDHEGKFSVKEIYPHNLGDTPVGRLTCFLDDEGNSTGIVDHLIAPQDRVNQTAFDLLSTQTFSAFKLRTASGVEGEQIYNADGEPMYNEDGTPQMRSIPVDPSTWVQTDNPDARFGTLDETPLDGFLEALRLSVQHFAVQGQLPPHALLGNLSNLSAETLVAAMSQTQRLAHVLKTSWGQTIVDLMELIARDMDTEDHVDPETGLYKGEVRWRDMSDHTLAAQVDALGKGAQMLEIPTRALWPKFPGVSTGEIEEWERLREEERMDQFDDPRGEDASVQRESVTQPRQPPAQNDGIVPLGGGDAEPVGAPGGL